MSGGSGGYGFVLIRTDSGFLGWVRHHAAVRGRITRDTLLSVFIPLGVAKSLLNQLGSANFDVRRNDWEGMWEEGRYGTSSLTLWGTAGMVDYRQRHDSITLMRVASGTYPVVSASSGRYSSHHLGNVLRILLPFFKRGDALSPSRPVDGAASARGPTTLGALGVDRVQVMTGSGTSGGMIGSSHSRFVLIRADGGFKGWVSLQESTYGHELDSTLAVSLAPATAATLLNKLSIVRLQPGEAPKTEPLCLDCVTASSRTTFWGPAGAVEYDGGIAFAGERYMFQPTPGQSSAYRTDPVEEAFVPLGATLRADVAHMLREQSSRMSAQPLHTPVPTGNSLCLY